MAAAPGPGRGLGPDRPDHLCGPAARRREPALSTVGRLDKDTSGLLLLAALGFQAAGYRPCELCLLQRWPHLAALLVGAVVLLARACTLGPRVTVLLAGLATMPYGLHHLWRLQLYGVVANAVAVKMPAIEMPTPSTAVSRGRPATTNERNVTMSTSSAISVDQTGTART